MKLRHFIYSICLAGVSLTACQKEDALENTLDVTSPYVLDYLANSEDRIDSLRYAIFEEFGVPVFLHDVITEEVVGTDYKGDPIYKRETLDISWEFYHDANTSYSFTYLISEETEEEENPDLTDDEKAALEAAKEAKRQKEREDAYKALIYAKTYLSMAGATKPFSIMLVKNLIYNGQIVEFHKGFRTLFISNASSYPEEAQMRAKSGEIINASVLPMVQLDEAFMDEFETISEENHYYGKRWQADLGETFSSDMTTFVGSPCYFKLEHAFDESKLTSLSKNNTMYTSIYYDQMGWGAYIPMYGLPPLDFCKKYYNNVDAIKELALELVAIAGKYGFIGGGWKNSHIYAPDVDQDIEAFVMQALKLGAIGFEKRYGAYPIVMQKFNLIKDYIENVLGVSLNYTTI